MADHIRNYASRGAQVSIGSSEASTPRSVRREENGADDKFVSVGFLPELARTMGGTTPNTYARSSYDVLQAKMANKVDESMALTDEMERLGSELREVYKRHLVQLKELELERIELQTAVHWFLATRQNWANQHRIQGVDFSAELDAQLAEEQEATEASLRATDNNLRVLTAQLGKVRKAKDSLDAQLVERRRHLFMENTILEHTTTTLRGLEARLTSVKVNDFKVPPLPRRRTPRSGSNTPSLAGSLSAR
jgi:hypothetical protein